MDTWFLGSDFLSGHFADGRRAKRSESSVLVNSIGVQERSDESDEDSRATSDHVDEVRGSLSQSIVASTSWAQRTASGFRGDRVF